MPSAAVQLGPQGVYAYLVKPDNTVQMVPIKVSAANPGAPVTLVESGLSADDIVVIDGQVKLRPGVTVKATAEPPEAPPVAISEAPRATPATPPAPPPAPSPAKALAAPAPQ